MKLREIMSNAVVRIHPDETVAVASRMLEHNNIGALPVCGSDGRLCGMLTDRDIVIRCVAAGKPVQSTSVREIMTSKVYVGRPDMDVSLAAGLMGREQIRRLPVMENGRLCGLVSLGDMARMRESTGNAADVLSEVSSNISHRG